MMIQTTEAMWVSNDRQATVLVTYVSTDIMNNKIPPVLANHAGHKYMYKFYAAWELSDSLILKGDDINSGGVCSDINAIDAMMTLGSFVDAWVEAFDSQHYSDNLKLFPMVLQAWTDKYGEEFTNDMTMHEYMMEDNAYYAARTAYHVAVQMEDQ